jgi:hypothetical protein
MCKTTTRTQAAAQKPVSAIQPNQPTGTHAPPPLPPNAFLGKPERVPQLMYVTSLKGDGFLGQAKDYYEFFGIEVKLIRSIHEMVIDLGKRKDPFERIGVVSHAHPLGMFLPMFTNAVPGTNKAVFNGLAKSDYDGLLSMSPFSPVGRHLFDWKTKVDRLMKVARTNSAAALKPFGLDKDGTPPAGDMSEFFFHCFDAVFMKVPDNVTNKGAKLAPADQKTLLNFIGEILNQLSKRLEGKTVNGHTVTADELKALRTGLTKLPFADFNIVETFDLDLVPENMNFFPSLVVMVKAIKGGFRDQLEKARTRLSGTSRVDARGCRVGEDPEYLESIGAFLGTTDARPTVTGPQLFQAYAEFFFDTLNSRANIRTWLSNTQRMHSPQKLRELLTKWAETIRVKPLHSDFWKGILEGRTVRLLALVETDVPKLFIPAPGLKNLFDADVAKSIRALADFFNVANADVPAAPAAMNALKAAATRVKAAAPSLLAPVADNAAPARLQELYEALRDIDKAENQTLVPDTPPTPLRAVDIRNFQKKLLDYFDATPLADLKKFMTAAAKSLNEGDGLYYYMFFAGLPVFIFGRPESQKNSIVVFTRHATDIQQSWYQCLWKDPLPPKGTYKTARIAVKLAHTMPALFNEDHVSLESVCPLPRYGLCMRIRPLPADEVDGECGNLSNP